MRLSSPTDFWKISVGFREIYGQSGTWEEIEERLRFYTLGEVLEALGQISIVLNRFDRAPEDNLREQSFLCQRIFGEGAKVVYEKALSSVRQDKRSSTCFFYDLQLINAAKLALLYLEVDDHIDETKPLSSLGEVLFMITDLINQETEPSPGDPGEDVPQEWMQFFITNGLFHTGGRFFTKMTRSHDLYLTDRSQLKRLAAYIDLPTLSEGITGLKPSELWCGLFALVSHWMKVDLASHKVNGRLDVDAYLSKLKLNAQQFFGFAVGSARKIQKEVRDRYEPGLLAPYDVLPLARKPVVKMGGYYYCTSASLLQEKLSTGLYHLFLDPKETTEGERKRFLNYVGRVVEEYVN